MEQLNYNQAFLFIQNEIDKCVDEQQRNELLEDYNKLVASGNVSVKNTLIVIVSYNACYMMQKNIESIRRTAVKGTYKILVVDNASRDGAREWLEKQEDILLICNEENVGFAPACNQAIKSVKGTEYENYDVFLLNNDTRLAENSLFWLRMGLYQNDKVGATGSVSNYAGNNQQIDVEFTLPDEYLEYGKNVNVGMEKPFEERTRLSGFAMLIRSGLWTKIGGMDEEFAPGYFEDDDLSMKIQRAGYKLLLCKNSFIYHAGSQSFAKCERVNELILEHHKLFCEKYKFDILEHAYPNVYDVSGIKYEKEDEFNVLFVECGLGEDMKDFRSLYPNAHLVGVEYNTAMYDIAKNTEVVFHDLDQLCSIFKYPVFSVVFIKPKVVALLNQKQVDQINGLCLPGCVIPKIVTPNEENKEFDKIKLVIWDMDQTFWKGVISEGNIEVIEENIELVKELTDCGIVNSISSKNDYDVVMAELEKLGIKKYFVFADINWDSKGEQIKNKLNDMHLRAENTLFIDDEIHNLEETVFYNDGIMVGEPSIIPKLARYISKKEKKDLEHSRLKNYILLEEKREVSNSFSSKEDFLQYSNIEVCIKKDCENRVDRIVELVARTNQLNYTKKRDTQEEIEKLLHNENLDKGYVCVKDRFGDYGIVGFYCFDSDGDKLEHLLFSCRIVGMGIPDYIYSYLKKPSIEVIEPVAEKLGSINEFPWINFIEATNTTQGVNDIENKGTTDRDNKINILLKGPCDISAIESYLIGGNITTEFNFVNKKGFITTGQNHSVNICESAKLTQNQLYSIVNEVPFITMGDFETNIFKKEYHVICYSLLPDCHTGLYKNKKTGHYISFGSKNFDLTDKKNMAGYIDGTIVNHAFPFTEEIINKFSDNWEYVGVTPINMLIENLDYMYENAPGNPMFILLLGSEIEYEGFNEEFADHAKWHIEVNKVIKEYAADRDRIRIINMTDFIKTQDDYEDCINHFSRNVYYDLATEVVKFINEKVDSLKR